jgi:hypothetical protein
MPDPLGRRHRLCYRFGEAVDARSPCLGLLRRRNQPVSRIGVEAEACRQKSQDCGSFGSVEGVIHARGLDQKRGDGQLYIVTASRGVCLAADERKYMIKHNRGSGY